jgi:hypothetical protein
MHLVGTSHGAMPVWPELGVNHAERLVIGSYGCGLLCGVYKGVRAIAMLVMLATCHQLAVLLSAHSVNA